LVPEVDELLAGLVGARLVRDGRAEGARRCRGAGGPRTQGHDGVDRCREGRLERRKLRDLLVESVARRGADGEFVLDHGDGLGVGASWTSASTCIASM